MSANFFLLFTHFSHSLTCAVFYCLLVSNCVPVLSFSCFSFPLIHFTCEIKSSTCCLLCFKSVLHFKVKSLEHSEANLKPLKKPSIEDLSGPFLLSFSLSLMGGILGLQTAGSYGFLSSALLLQ